MTEKRVAELNSLIKIYNEFGIVSPYFIAAKDGCFIKSDEGNTIYLSEYLNMKIAEELIEEDSGCKEDLKRQRLVLISRFAEKFNNKLGSSSFSMYSLFDLSSYDISYGIDEKQQNLNELCDNFKKIGEKSLAEKLIKESERIRARLLAIYKSLPRCVFQGDENFSNVCVDEQNQIAGLFDFNMSGMDVNANYLANNALMDSSVLDDDLVGNHDAKWVFDEIIRAFFKSKDLIC